MADQDRRNSDRVSIELHLKVSGSDTAGQSFLDDARTLVVTRHGATIELGRRLAPEQEVTICCTESGREEVARIVGQIEEQAALYSYGIIFLNPEANPWDIEFPAFVPGNEAIGRVLLACIRCHTREVAYLDAAELEVLEANHSLSRHCKRCGDASIWKRAFGEVAGAESEPVQISELPRSIPASPKERRGEGRRPLKVRACVHTEDFDEDIVMTRNVSRGGLCFESQKIYGLNWRVEIAVPYDPRGGNIFLQARIARVQHVSDDLKLYGIAYIRELPN